jgi:hypothetical protein
MVPTKVFSDNTVWEEEMERLEGLVLEGKTRMEIIALTDPRNRCYIKAAFRNVGIPIK